MRAPPGPAWWWRHVGIPTGGTPAASEPAGPPFPQGRLPLAVDLFMFGNWVDVSSYVYQRDRVAIARGRSSEAGLADPTSIRLTLDNRDGRFSPRNPLGPFYGQLGRNTQLRVRVGNDVRGTGEVPAWPPKWDLTGADVWTPVEASGILRRLQQGVAPLRSPMYRFILSGTVSDYSFILVGQPVAYWPCEDAAGSTQLASAVGGPPMTVSGSPALADNGDFAGSDPIPTVSLSRWTGVVPAYTSASGTHTVGFLLSVPAAGITDGVILLRAQCSGTAARFDIKYLAAGVGALQVLVYDPAGTNVFSSGSFAFDDVEGHPMQVEMRLYQDGADVSIGFNYATVTNGGAGSADGPVAGRTIGRVTTTRVGPNGDVDQAAVGHVSVWAGEAALTGGGASEFLPLIGYPGETAGTRIARLCAQEGIAYVRVPPSHTSTRMGAQHSGALVDLLRECEAADQGILFEPRTFLGLAYVDRQALYNRTAAVTLDYPSADLSQIEPTDDDLLVRNDWTVTRTGGSSAAAVLESGALSVQDPPDGVGRYDTAVTVNVQFDGQLPDQAGWRLHLGTVDEPRYPQIGVNLARANFAGSAALTDAAAALDVGGLVAVTGPPAWLPPGGVAQIAVGFGETLNAFERTVVVNCVPASPYTVGVYDDDTARYSSDGSTLAAEAAAGGTALTVATPTGPLWSDADGPFDMIASGERVTVTAIVGAASPQTFTVVRAVNGISKTLPAGAAVELAVPAVYAL